MKRYLKQYLELKPNDKGNPKKQDRKKLGSFFDMLPREICHAIGEFLTKSELFMMQYRLRKDDVFDSLDYLKLMYKNEYLGVNLKTDKQLNWVFVHQNMVSKFANTFRWLHQSLCDQFRYLGPFVDSTAIIHPVEFDVSCSNLYIRESGEKMNASFINREDLIHFIPDAYFPENVSTFIIDKIRAIQVSPLLGITKALYFVLPKKLRKIICVSPQNQPVASKIVVPALSVAECSQKESIIVLNDDRVTWLQAAQDTYPAHFAVKFTTIRISGNYRDLQKTHFGFHLGSSVIKLAYNNVKMGADTKFALYCFVQHLLKNKFCKIKIVLKINIGKLEKTTACIVNVPNYFLQSKESLTDCIDNLLIYIDNRDYGTKLGKTSHVIEEMSLEKRLAVVRIESPNHGLRAGFDFAQIGHFFQVEKQCFSFLRQIVRLQFLDESLLFEVECDRFNYQPYDAASFFDQLLRSIKSFDICVLGTRQSDWTLYTLDHKRFHLDTVFYEGASNFEKEMATINRKAQQDIIDLIIND